MNIAEKLTAIEKDLAEVAPDAIPSLIEEIMSLDSEESDELVRACIPRGMEALMAITRYGPAAAMAAYLGAVVTGYRLAQLDAEESALPYEQLSEEIRQLPEADPLD